MKFHIIIPTRYAATRLPGKPLLDIAGKPMLQHVYERALASGAASVVIATDDERILEVAQSFGATVCWTKVEHQSGTERLAEAVTKLELADDQIVVNVQGDEPLIPPEIIRQAADALAMNPNADIATLCEPIRQRDDLLNPNVVKVVRNQAGYALYFSRAPIAWDRAAEQNKRQAFSAYAKYYRHIGLYAYRVGAIKQYVKWPMCPLEQMEALEQLRVLWHGGKIYVAEAIAAVPAGVDTPADIERVRKLCNNN